MSNPFKVYEGKSAAATLRHFQPAGRPAST